MNELKVFNNPEFGKVRTVEINGGTLAGGQGCGRGAGVQ